MEVADLHVGSQLKVASNAPGGVPGLQDLVYGVGPTMVPGTAWIESGLLVGSPQTYPVPNGVEATLMVARAPVTNPKAVVAPSIFKVSSKLNIPPTPIDVMFGDPLIGQVGVTFNTAMINILNSTVINIVTPNSSLDISFIENIEKRKGYLNKLVSNINPTNASLRNSSFPEKVLFNIL